MVAHDDEPGLPAGAGVPRGPELPDGLQPFPQNSVRDQVQDPQDPASTEPLPLGEIQEVSPGALYLLYTY